MRPPGFIVKSSSDLCPNVLLRIRFRFLFSTLFSRDLTLSRQGKLENTDIVVASLPSDFHRFLLLRAEWIFAPSFTEWEYPRLSERIACFQRARASSVLSFRRYASDILLVSIFIRPCDRSHRAVLLDSVFASEKCANACEAREHPPSTQTPAQPSFSRRCCDIAGSVYGPRLSDIRRRVRRMRRSSRRGFLYSRQIRVKRRLSNLSACPTGKC